MRPAMVLLAFAVIALGVYVGIHRNRGQHSPSVKSVIENPANTNPRLAVAPNLSVTDLNGDALQTAKYKGKVVLVNFWAAWCTPCAEEVPQFIALQKKYQDQGLQVIGVSVEDDARELRNFYRKYQMNYPVVPGDIKIADAFGGVLGLPTTFVIGKDNLVHGKHDGATDFSALEREVVALLHAGKG
jgi:cytochrome c biogenesis protein CcmG/thiol:disulfide interchange protein DsbE